MAGLIVMAAMPHDDGLTEFDSCSLCGHVTSLLVMCRFHDMLISYCGPCIKELQRGFDKMMEKRMAFKMDGYAGDR